MVTGPNGLVLKIFFLQISFKIYFKFELKIKKKSVPVGWVRRKEQVKGCLGVGGKILFYFIISIQ